MEQIGKQVEIPGTFWQGRQTAEERSTKYKSAVHRAQLHKFPGKLVPEAASELQEMGVAG